MDSPDLPAWLYVSLVSVLILVMCWVMIQMARQGGKPQNRMSYSEWEAWLDRQEPDRTVTPTLPSDDTFEQAPDTKPAKPTP